MMKLENDNINHTLTQTSHLTRRTLPQLRTYK